MNKISKPLFIALSILLLSSICQKVYSQTKENSFKAIVSTTGLGASYEMNVLKLGESAIFVEPGLTTAFTVTRASIQSKLLVYKNQKDLRVKFGVEAAYIYGNFVVGSIGINYDRFNNLLFMPMASVEGRVIGLQIPVIITGDFKTFFPIIALTFNISKDDEPNPHKDYKRYH
jgi:hypothetical protein